MLRAFGGCGYYSHVEPKTKLEVAGIWHVVPKTAQPELRMPEWAGREGAREAALVLDVGWNRYTLSLNLGLHPVCDWGYLPLSHVSQADGSSKTQEHPLLPGYQQPILTTNDVALSLFPRMRWPKVPPQILCSSDLLVFFLSLSLSLSQPSPHITHTRYTHTPSRHFSYSFLEPILPSRFGFTSAVARSIIPPHAFGDHRFLADFLSRKLPTHSPPHHDIRLRHPPP